MIDASFNHKNPISSESLTVTVWAAGARIGYPKGTTKKLLDERRFPLEIRKLGRNRVCLRSDVEAFVYKELFGRDTIPGQPVIDDATPEVTKAKRGPGRPRKTVESV